MQITVSLMKQINTLSLQMGWIVLVLFQFSSKMLLSVGTLQEIIRSISLHTINHSKHKLSPSTKYGKDYYQIIPGYI